MKKILILLLVLISTAMFAQTKKPKAISKFIRKEDKLVLNLNWDNWLNASEGIDVKSFRSRGFSFMLMNEKMFGPGNLGIAWGLGFSSQNVHSNAFPTYNEDESKTYLSPFPSSVDYDLNKLSCNFIDAQFEFRLRSNENEHRKRFKLYVGIKGGYLVQSHTKFDSSAGKFKTYDIKNLNLFQYGLTTRIGYARWGINGYYSLIDLFESGKGPGVVPVSIGLSYAL